MPSSGPVSTHKLKIALFFKKKKKKLSKRMHARCKISLVYHCELPSLPLGSVFVYEKLCVLHSHVGGNVQYSCLNLLSHLSQTFPERAGVSRVLIIS